VQSVCDHVVVLGKGRVLRQGSLTELLGEASGGYELGFVGDAEAVRRTLEALGHSCAPEPNGTLTVAMTSADTTDVIAAVARAGASLRRLEPIQRSLEEVFLAAVKEATHAGV
jgi:ABC-2 type transport system ATP-binding protein